jgi:CheY-like chemotaxis protein
LDTSATRVTNRRGRVLLVVSDLIFGVRLADAARALGFEAKDIAVGTLPQALGDDVALVVLDTGQRGDWEAAIRAMKTEPATAAIPVLAYGSHVDVTASRAAVAAGVDRLVTRGKLMAELPLLLESTARAVPDAEASG